MKQDFRKWSHKQIRGDLERTLWPVWVRIVFLLLLIGLCALVWWQLP